MSHTSDKVGEAANNLVVRVYEHLEKCSNDLLDVIYIEVLVPEATNVENPDVAVYSRRHRGKDVILNEQYILLLLLRGQVT